MQTDYDIAIIGAGAAGLTAAIFARRAAPDARIVALDGAPKIGAKILISGGGRCNVTHDVVTPDDFNGNRNAVAKVLRTFTVEQTVDWLAGLGVALKREETGKLFPTTDRARTVVDALLRGCEGVEIRTRTRVVEIARVDHADARGVIPREVEESPADGGGAVRSAGDPSTSLPMTLMSSLSLRPAKLVQPAEGFANQRSRPGRLGMTREFMTRDSAGAFTLTLSDGTTLTAKRVILATGGRSVPKTGSDGAGYLLARSLGHTTTETFPALVPLLLEEGHWMTALSGTSVEAELSVRAGKVLVRHRGSLLFTHFGISGPVVLDVSRHWIAATKARAVGTLIANFLPGETFESVDASLVGEARANPRATIASVLRGRLPERLLTAIASDAAPLGKLSKDERRRIVRALVESVVPVVRDRGFDYAEVTAGGVPLTEVDLATMASRKCAALYLCGEILDVDGRIGGYNFQWAWASGRLAGSHAARSLHRPEP